MKRRLLWLVVSNNANTHCSKETNKGKMSKGMWTKHYTEDGKIFYFNAAQNRSVWTTPFDAIIHEAPNLQKPTEKLEAIPNEEENPAISLISPENNSESIQPFPATVVSQVPIGQYSLFPQTIDVQPTPILTSSNLHQDDINSKRNNEL